MAKPTYFLVDIATGKRIQMTYDQTPPVGQYVQEQDIDPATGMPRPDAPLVTARQLHGQKNNGRVHWTQGGTFGKLPPAQQQKFASVYQPQAAATSHQGQDISGARDAANARNLVSDPLLPQNQGKGTTFTTQSGKPGAGVRDPGGDYDATGRLKDYVPPSPAAAKKPWININPGGGLNIMPASPGVRDPGGDYDDSGRLRDAPLVNADPRADLRNRYGRDPSIGRWHKLPDGQVYDAEQGSTYADSRMLPPEARAALNLNAQTDPQGQAAADALARAPKMVDGVQTNVQGNPTTGERAGGIRPTDPMSPAAQPGARPGDVPPPAPPPSVIPPPVYGTPPAAGPRRGAINSIQQPMYTAEDLAGLTPSQRYDVMAGVSTLPRRGAVPDPYYGGTGLLTPPNYYPEEPARPRLPQPAWGAGTPQVSLRETGRLPAPAWDDGQQPAPRRTLFKIQSTGSGTGLTPPQYGPRAEETADSTGVAAAPPQPPQPPKEGDTKTEEVPGSGGMLQQFVWKVPYSDGIGFWDRLGSPITPIRPTRDPNLPAPRDAAAIAQDEAAAAAARANAAANAARLPGQLASDAANAAQSAAATNRTNTLLPGEVKHQEANTSYIYEQIDNLRRQGRVAEAEQKLKEGIALGIVNGQETLQSVQIKAEQRRADARLGLDADLGYADSRRADSRLGLDENRLRLEADLGYAGSRRADAAQSGYLGNGDPTFERELAAANQDLANFKGRSDAAYQQAQVALQQGNQEEARRQFDISDNFRRQELDLSRQIQGGRLDLDRQGQGFDQQLAAAKFAAEQRANPSSWLDQVRAQRGEAIPTVEPTTPHDPYYGGTGLLTPPSYYAEQPAPRRLPPPQYDASQAQDNQYRGVLPPPQYYASPQGATAVNQRYVGAGTLPPPQYGPEPNGGQMPAFSPEMQARIAAQKGQPQNPQLGAAMDMQYRPDTERRLPPPAWGDAQVRLPQPEYGTPPMNNHYVPQAQGILPPPTYGTPPAATRPTLPPPTYGAPPGVLAPAKPLDYSTIRDSSATPSGIKSALEGRAPGSFRTAGNMPILSAQRLNSLSSAERQGLTSALKATGNDPDSYYEESKKLSATGDAPQTFRKRSLPPPKYY